MNTKKLWRKVKQVLALVLAVGIITNGWGSYGLFVQATGTTESLTVTLANGETGVEYGTDFLLQVKYGEETIGEGNYNVAWTDAEGNTLTGTPADAGSYTGTVTATVTKDDEQVPASGTMSLVITPKKLSVDWGAEDFTYNGSAQTPVITVDGKSVNSASPVAVGIEGDECDVSMNDPDMKDVGDAYQVILSLSGADAANYELSASECTYAVKAKSLNTEGENQVAYYLKSPDGYVSDKKEAVFHVDITAPTISDLTVSGNNEWAQSKQIIFDVTETNPQRVYYTVDGGSATDLEVTDGGSYTVEVSTDHNETGKTYQFVVVDKAGNETASEYSITVSKVDVSKPKIANVIYTGDGIVSVANSAEIFVNAAKTFSFDCTDELSGVDEVTCVKTVNDSEETNVTVSLTDDKYTFTMDNADADKTVAYKIYATDQAGNQSEVFEFTVVYDITAPQVTNKGLWEGTTEFTTENSEADTPWINSRNDNMTWQLEITDLNGESGYGISDIAGVEYKTDDSEEWQSADMESGTCIIPISVEDYKGEYRLLVKDKAGNAAAIEKQWVKVDKTFAEFENPSIVGTAGASDTDMVTWYNAEILSLNVKVTDGGSSLSGIKKVFATTESMQDISSVTEAMLESATNVIVCADAVDDVWTFAIRDADFNTRTYFFYALDNAGNVTKCNTTLSLKRDSQKPDAGNILVSYASSDLENSISKEDVGVIKKIQGLVKNIFVKKEITVTLYVPDAIGKDHTEKVFSGIDQITVEYNGKAVESITKTEGHHAYAQTGDVYESASNTDEVYSIFEVTLKVPEDANPKEITDKLTITSIRDLAGNENDKVAEVVIASDNLIILDDVAPVLSKAEHTTSASDLDKRHFYNAESNEGSDPVVNLEITETNFMGKVNENEGEEILVKPEFENLEGFGFAILSDWSFEKKIAKGVVTLPRPENTETEYQYTLGYHDPSGNLMTGADGITVSAEGIYTSDIFVVDTLAPILKKFAVVSADKTKPFVTETTSNLEYAANMEGADVQIEVEIDDNADYFNEAAVNIEYCADEADEWNQLDDSAVTWTVDGRIHSAVFEFDGADGEEHTYRFRVSYSDRAKNAMVLSTENAPSVTGEKEQFTSTQQVVIDHCAPKLTKMSFAEPVTMYDGEKADVNGNTVTTVTNANTRLYYAGNITADFAISDKYLANDTIDVKILDRANREAAWPKEEETDATGVTATEETKAYTVLMPAVDGEYYFTISYTDRAGNKLVYADSVETNNQGEAYANGISSEGIYQSPQLIRDTMAPFHIAEYTVVKGETKTNPTDFQETYDNSADSIQTVLTVTETNLDMENTIVAISALDLDGEQIPVAELSHFTKDETKKLYTATWQDLLEADEANKTTTASYKGNKGTQTLTLNLSTEARYNIQIHVQDKVKKYDSYAEEYCIDRTAPEITVITDEETYTNEVKSTWCGVLQDNSDITYTVVNGGTFARVINKISFGYFAKLKIVAHVKVHDKISGVESIVPSYVNEGKAETGYIVEEKERKGSYVLYDITFPANFKGTLSAHGIDKAGNAADDTGAVGFIAESESMHKERALAKIEVLTKYSKTRDFYNGNVDVKFTAIDGYSGFHAINYQAGDWKSSQEEKAGDEILLEIVTNHTISASSNNSNNIEFLFDFEDNAGHTFEVPEEELPIVHIDTTAPKIEVVYDNMDVLNEKYYKADRIATITITERNFDPSDTWLDITGPDPEISGWSHVAGSGCTGHSPDDTTHVDSCKWVATVNYYKDGDYTFTCRTTDLAGNSVDYGQTDEFTIDKTLPEINVTYNNHDVMNELYYKESRRATIEINEHNFAAQDVTIVMTAKDDGRVIAIPGVSPWTSSGDLHTATIAYDYDGEFTFDIDFTDMAGNQAADYTEDHFIVDLTAPEIEIFDIEHMSANNGVVMPGIRYSDTNYDADGTVVVMKGYHNGIVEMKGNRKIIANGVEFKLNDFEHIREMDDLYTMEATVYDLAGNSSEATVMFSVNRFGSVYTFDDATEALVGENGSYYTDEEQNIVVLETNVDTLEFKEITLNVNGKLSTLKEGTHYTVAESGSDVSWKQYRYTIDKANFKEEGTYILTIYSEDRANNTSDNNTKGKKIEFVVDKTNPSILISGVANDEQYREHSREVTLDVEDNVRMAEVEVVLNGEGRTYTAAEVAAMDGKITFTAGSSNNWQTLKVSAYDAAGNQETTEEMRFLITANIFVQFYRNTPVFIGTICAVTVLGAGLRFILAKKKKSEEETK